jgi:hypothetical protein
LHNKPKLTSVKFFCLPAQSSQFGALSNEAKTHLLLETSFKNK